ncbi:MAG: hypothetical protein K0Q49_1519 [Haloplasmataceae bacterium]|nr:hypothetical protein [Haloplasmataceae bacterium]
MSEILNILNGQAMVDYYFENDLNVNGNYIPFNEAMCVGNVSKDIFSDEFIKNRCIAHHVSLEEYRKITLEPLQLLLNQQFSNLILWFDDDMFCQINYLTVLAYLDQINYNKKVTLILVTQDFKLIDTYELDVSGYHDLYTQVLMNHKLTQEITLSYLNKGIELYLEYIKEDNEITRYIKNNKDLPKQELLKELINAFPQYGLGDTQYVELINKL